MISKLPWEQRVIIGGLVQNHKESYAAYEQGRRLYKKVDDLKGKMMDSLEHLERKEWYDI